MTSQSIPSQTQDSYDFDDNSFRTHSQRGPNDSTGVPDFPADEAEGLHFTPFNIEYRDFQIKSLPQKTLELFQLFVPISLVQSWIEYTNDWVAHLIENAVINNWNSPLKEHSRILQWEGISAATALGDQRPLHPVTKFMPLRKFELITRYFRTFDYTKLDVSDKSDLPKVFQAAEPWSDHIQNVSAELFIPGTNLAVDKYIIAYKGRSKETTLVKNKPTPVGFKVWVIAQHGFFLRWLWHMKRSPYKAIVIKLPVPKPQGKKGKTKTTVTLSNTQSVVFHLCNMLPKATYHIFTDNLFSSPNLFRALREAGYGATGTARPNCGISKLLKKAKESDKSGNGATFQYNEVRVIFTIDGLVSQIAWKDNSLMLFLLTVHSGADKERTEKKR
ncbi:uncharacterized protein FRV6_11724 [Fusarium oxysporum]|uniref:PiggyBac transposable element-derived protein domain-containing protein n=1 Tax=Fusarium oxysporum TaxID=5507 RepID=A0A2H3TG66_FUSOX|nr:uncharacterized protein FRV6_11724 [Fusarium oxysporum]